MKPYNEPEVVDLGDLVSLTQQQFNKVGNTPDMYTPATAGVVVGSIVNYP